MRHVGRPGDKYGRLTLAAKLPVRGNRWLVRCDCGVERRVSLADMKSGNTSSCGCLRREMRTAKNMKHGESHSTAEYQIWKGIIKRCYNSKTANYQHYGGRGIGIHEEWRQNYDAFLTYVGRRPSPRHSIDRFPDKNGNYEPGNVRWATPDQQSRNTRRNVLIAFRGQTKVLQDWVIELGLDRKRVENRLLRGWPLERALSIQIFNSKGKALAL